MPKRPCLLVAPPGHRQRRYPSRPVRTEEVCMECGTRKPLGSRVRYFLNKAEVLLRRERHAGRA